MAGSSSRLGFGRAAGGTGPSTSTGFLPGIGGGMDTSLQRQNTEAPEKVKSHSASAVATYLGVNVTANTVATTPTVILRVATANGNNSVSVTASTTGWFEDSTHSDTLADGDLLDIAINAGTITGSLTMRTGACTLTTASGGADMYYVLSGTSGGPPMNTGFSTASTTWFLPINGQMTANNNGETTETNKSRTTFRAAGTLSNLQVYLNSQGRGNATTVASRINGGAGAQSVSLAPSTSGLKEDTTHSDTVTAGQSASYSITNGTGSGVTGIAFIGSKYASSDAKSDIFASAVTATTTDTNATTYYGGYGFYHTANAETTEANAQVSCPYANRFTNLRCYVETYSLGSPVTFSFRNGGAPGNGSVSLNATGIFEDSTNHDDVSAANKFCYSMTSPGGTSGIVAPWFASTQVATASLNSWRPRTVMY